MADLNKKREYATSEFRGVNTQALRQAIGKGQQAWLENLQPIGDANLRAVPQCSEALLQLTNGVAPYYVQGFSLTISGSIVDVLIVADQAGDIWAVNLNAGTLTALTYGTVLQGQFTTTSAAQWQNSAIVFIDGIKGLYWWDGATFSNAGFVSKPSTGQCIATFANRLWVTNKRTVYFTAPNSYLDFTSGATGGGSFVLSDETLHSNIQQIVSANNFLYIFGEDSCNVISNVVYDATKGTTYTNTNLSTGVGTSFPLSISAYYRSVWFASQSGFYAMFGASAKKVSDELDGMFQQIIGTSNPAAIGQLPTFSSGLVSINNVLCIAFLFKYTDPNWGVRPLLAIYFDGKWFFANQGAIPITPLEPDRPILSTDANAPVIMVDAVVKGKNNLYCFDNSGYMYQMFSNTNLPTYYTWQTALWDFEQPIMYKQVVKAGIAAQFYNSSVSVTADIDSETSSNAFAFTDVNTLTFYGTGPITFVGTAPISWTSAGYFLMQRDVTNIGRYAGMTIYGFTYPSVFTLAMMEYNLRSQWGT